MPQQISAKEQQFWDEFKLHRGINRIYYQLVNEADYDFRMVDTPKRKSDTPRESLIHQIDTTRDYIKGIESGLLTFENYYPDLSRKTKLSKKNLLLKFQQTDTDLLRILFELNIPNIEVSVPWRQDKAPAIEVLWGLNSHEILHTGWNLAIMDHLNLPRFAELRAIWG